jgi:hypothetical protein
MGMVPAGSVSRNKRVKQVPKIVLYRNPDRLVLWGWHWFGWETFLFGTETFSCKLHKPVLGFLFFFYKAHMP